MYGNNKAGNNKAGTIFSAILCLLLAGCYRHWPQAAQMAEEINCQSNRQEVLSLARRYQAQLFGDAQAELLQFNKEADALLVQFDHSGTIVVVAIYRANIHFFGTYRTLADPRVVLNCESSPTSPMSLIGRQLADGGHLP